LIILLLKPQIASLQRTGDTQLLDTVADFESGKLHFKIFKVTYLPSFSNPSRPEPEHLLRRHNRYSDQPTASGNGDHL
jgi:hypothetical protein